jgi:hypothetical protein
MWCEKENQKLNIKNEKGERHARLFRVSIRMRNLCPDYSNTLQTPEPECYPVGCAYKKERIRGALRLF